MQRGLGHGLFLAVAAAAAACLATACGQEGVPCTGNATRCNTIAGAEACRLQAGCNPISRCRGEPRACADRPTASSCAADPGCAWQPATCRGEAWTCESFDRSYGGDDCARQLGCAWNETDRLCTGTSADCDGLDETTCGEQNGCGWYPYCDGSPTPCETLVTPVECGAIDGCLWDPDFCTGTAVACEELPVDLC
ncbi:MAG: hypothetical protein JXB32_25500, partial [Deltaproteobacteria bacterium]|nr:hypothetical protein [Deltaproteobacteria bacterium]